MTFYTLRVRDKVKGFFLAHGSRLGEPPFHWTLTENVDRAYRFRNIAVALRVVRGVLHSTESLIGWRWEIWWRFNHVAESGVLKKTVRIPDKRASVGDAPD